MYGFIRWLFYSVRKLFFKIIYWLYMPVYYILYIPFRIFYGPDNRKQANVYDLCWFILWFLLGLDAWLDSDTFLGGAIYLVTHLGSVNYKSLGVVALFAVGATLVMMFLFSIPKVKNGLLHIPFNALVSIKSKLDYAASKYDTAIHGAREQMDYGMTLEGAQVTGKKLKEYSEDDTARSAVEDYEEMLKAQKSPLQVQREKRQQMEMKQKVKGKITEQYHGTPDFTLPEQKSDTEVEKDPAPDFIRPDGK